MDERNTTENGKTAREIREEAAAAAYWDDRAYEEHEALVLENLNMVKALREALRAPVGDIVQYAKATRAKLDHFERLDANAETALTAVLDGVRRQLGTEEGADIITHAKRVRERADQRDEFAARHEEFALALDFAARHEEFELALDVAKTNLASAEKEVARLRHDRDQAKGGAKARSILGARDGETLLQAAKRVREAADSLKPSTGETTQASTVPVAGGQWMSGRIAGPMIVVGTRVRAQEPPAKGGSGKAFGNVRGWDGKLLRVEFDGGYTKSAIVEDVDVWVPVALADAIGAEAYLQLGRQVEELKAAIAAEVEERERLRALINTPELHDFVEAVKREAVHQRERWGTEHDAGKSPTDWLWLAGHLASKAAIAHVKAEGFAEGNPGPEHAERGCRDKALHHTISTAAVCLNWHAAITRSDTRMRPGIAPPPEAKAAPGGAS